MTHDDFDQVFEWIVGHVRSLMHAKSDEYSRGSDKHHNFKEAAPHMLAEGCTQLEAAYAFRVKHTVSIRDMIRDLRQGIHHPKALWVAKYGDEIAYRFLEFAMLHEEEGWPVAYEGTTTTVSGDGTTLRTTPSDPLGETIADVNIDDDAVRRAYGPPVNPENGWVDKGQPGQFGERPPQPSAPIVPGAIPMAKAAGPPPGTTTTPGTVPVHRGELFGGPKASEAHPPHGDRPVPPGEYLAEVLKEKGMTPREFADQTAWHQDQIHNLCLGAGVIGPRLAHDLERILHGPCATWLRLEAEYRTALAREHAEEHAAKGGGA